MNSLCRWAFVTWFLSISVFAGGQAEHADCFDEAVRLFGADAVGQDGADSGFMKKLRGFCSRPESTARMSLELKTACDVLDDKGANVEAAIAAGLKRDYTCFTLKTGHGKYHYPLVNLAATGDHRSAAAAFVKHGCFEDYKKGSEPTEPFLPTLVAAVQRKNVELVAALIEKGANVDANEVFVTTSDSAATYTNPLDYALNGFSDVDDKLNQERLMDQMAFQLIEAGADPNRAGSFAEPALFNYTQGSMITCEACKKVNPIVFSALFAIGNADPNAVHEGESLAMRAAGAGSLEALRLIVAFGGDPAYVDPKGISIVEVAVKRHHGLIPWELQKPKVEFLCQFPKNAAECNRLGFLVGQVI